MRAVIAVLALVFSIILTAQDGPLTNLANIPIRTDANGYIIAASQTYSGPDGPRRVLANTLGRTDANGYLIITNPTGFGAPLNAGYWVDTANATLTAERNLGALTTGLVLNTVTAGVGVPSTYAGSSTCTASEFIRALSAAGVATCATDGGGAPTDAGYWVDTANASLSAERNLGGLTTGLVLNTVTAGVGVPSAYAGVTCTNQFLRILSAAGVGTCATVSLTADVTGTLPVGNGGTGSTSFTAGSVIFSNGTILTQDNASLFWDDATNRLGIGTASPGALLQLGSYSVSAANQLHILSSNQNTTLRLADDSVNYGFDIVNNVAGRLEIVKHSNGVAGDIAITIDRTTGWLATAGTTAPLAPIHIANAGTAITGGGNKGHFLIGLANDFQLQFDEDDLQASTGTVASKLLLNRFGGNVLIGTASDASTGSAGLIFGDGTALATMGSNTAGFYADDVSGTVNIFGISEAGSVAPLTTALHGGAPTVGGSCGTGPTITGDNSAGKVTTGSVAPTSCTVTFDTAHAFQQAPSCNVTNETTANLARATSTLTTVILAGTMVAGDVLAYQCLGY